MSLRWNDAGLDRMRGVTDPILDEIVARHATERGTSVGRELGRLFTSTELPTDSPLVAECLSALPPVALTDPETVERGQLLFELFGPEILLILGSCALPLAYAAGNGVQVVARARRLTYEPIRRLCETAQMVINVMQPGTLGEGGLGWASARKVRLIHALVRRHVEFDLPARWDPAWGRPINQEDLTGTLLSFSVAVLHGLRKMGAEISTEQGDAYIKAWAAVGRLLGIDDWMLPSSESEASELAFAIGRRQIRPTPEGRELSQHLLEAVGSLFPVSGYACSLNHFFLADTAFGSGVIDALGLPDPNWTRHLVRARATQKRFVLRLLGLVPGGAQRRSFFARHFTQAMLNLQRPRGPTPFAVPERLRRSWSLGSKC